MSSFSLERNLFTQLWDMQEPGLNQLLVPYSESSLQAWGSYQGRLLKLLSPSASLMSGTRKMVLVRVKSARQVAERIHVDLWVLWKSRDGKGVTDQCLSILDSLAVQQDARIRALEMMAETFQARILELQAAITGQFVPVPPRGRRAIVSVSPARRRAVVQISPPPLYTTDEEEVIMA
jgi:hypothetical protein